MSLFKRATAECIGTFALVFFAVGTAVMTGGDLVATAMAFGLVIVAMAYSIGNISGCHVNPAVSLGVWIAAVLNGKKDFGGKEFCVYTISQFVGATIAATILYWIIIASQFDITVWGTNSIHNGIVLPSFVLETIGTAVFVYVILVVCNTKASAGKAGIVIGGTLTLIHGLMIQFTGTSVNPARSFGPAFMRQFFDADKAVHNQAMHEWWVFLLAPLLGAVIAAITYKLLTAGEGEGA